jgi:hypothetical protein
LLGSCLLYWSLVELVARVLVSALVLLLLFEAFYPVRFPLHWYLASVSCLVGNWSLITCFDRPLSLSLGSWAFQLFYFGSTECTSLLAHLRYWCLASVSCVITFGAFWLALLVPWACCSGPGLADASACVFGILHLARSSLCLTHCVCRLVFIFALFGT